MRKPFAVLPVLVIGMESGNARANRPAEHLSFLDYPSMVWQSDGNGSLFVRGRFTQGEVIDFVSLMLTNAQVTTTLRVRLGDTQSEVDGSAPYDSGAILIRDGQNDVLNDSFLELDNAVTCSWVRLDIAGHNGDFQAANLVMGRRLIPDDYHDRDFEFGVRDLGEVDESATGIVSEQPGAVKRWMQLRFSYMEQATFRSDFGPMIEKVASRGLVYWCMDADNDRQANTYLGRFSQPPFARGTALDGRYGIEFRVESLI